MDTGILLATLISGLALGSLYIIMSMGLTISFSTLGLFNFSHGHFIMVGAFVVWFFMQHVGENFLIAVPLMLILCFALGVVVNQILKIVRVKGTLMDMIIITLAIALLLENIILLIFGGRLKRLPPVMEGNIKLGDIFISIQNVLVIVFALSILIALWYMLRKTKVGMAMRAIAEEPDSSYLVGIPVERIYIYVIGISCCLAGFAGVFIGGIYFITPAMGYGFLTKAFIVCVLGGLDSVKGTIVAGFIVGITEAFTALLVGIYWTPIVLFIVMISIIMVRPSGLFGSKAVIQ